MQRTWSGTQVTLQLSLPISLLTRRPNPIWFPRVFIVIWAATSASISTPTSASWALALTPVWSSTAAPWTRIWPLSTIPLLLWWHRSASEQITAQVYYQIGRVNETKHNEIQQQKCPVSKLLMTCKSWFQNEEGQLKDHI